MGRKSTARFAVSLLALALAAWGQGPRWRQIGNSSLEAGLASHAGGPAVRVWFQPDGSASVLLPSGRAFTSPDLETWRPETGQPPAAESAAAARLPESAPLVRAARSGSPTLFAAGRHAWRSDDAGLSWHNLTAIDGESILGGALRDIAVDPNSAERILAAAATGVWFSSDGGQSWLGLNDGLPSLPVRRIVAAPRGARGLRIGIARNENELSEFEWAPGERAAWTRSGAAGLDAEITLRTRLSAALAAHVTAVATSGETLAAGDSAGRLFVSPDNGRTWRTFGPLANSGAVERIQLDPADRTFALAALSSTAGPRVLRTLNSGVFWDDLSANLPEGPAYGLAADRATGAIYVATASGLYLTYADLRAPAPSTAWSALANLPGAAVRDVRLDEPGNLLLAAVDGYGVYSTLAPHRTRSPQLAHSADYAARAAAPGALLSVLGARVASASANTLATPVLSAAGDESQIQVPFEVSGDSLRLVVESESGRVVFGLPLQRTAPAILIDRDGSPMLIDADSGVQLDAMHPARAGMRVQILMSGLGRVEPDWPTGLAAPLENAPRVTAPLRATLDGIPLEIERATLAPGYIGYYLIEVVLPDLVDSGASELAVEADGVSGNRVRVYVGQS